MLAHVYFKIPKKKSIYYLQGKLNNKAEIIKTNTKQTYFVISNFNQQNLAYHITPKNIIKVNKNYTQNHPFYFNNNVNLVAKNYKQIVQQAITDLNKKDTLLTKIVLAHSLEKNHNQVNILQVFKTICSTYPNHFCYLISHPKIGTMIGATPEVLLNTSNTQCFTVALAGTITNPKIGWRKKEIAEQELVQQHIIQVLNQEKIAFKKSKLTTIKSGNLYHLQTKFKFSLPNTAIAKTLAKLNPTPAVAGLPVNFSISYIYKNESLNRQFYSGFVGIINWQHTNQLYVNLRCATLHKNKIKLYAGAGITKQSNAAKEYQETLNKFKAIGSFFT